MNLICSINSNQGTLLSDPKQIIKGLSFFQNLWNSNYPVCFDGFPEIEPCISRAENNMLTALTSEDEIKRIVWAMPNFKSPRPDGFGPSFYRIVKEDLISNIGAFFKFSKSPNQ